MDRPRALRRLAAELNEIQDAIETIAAEAASFQARTEDPSTFDRIHLRALGSILHDFYTAVEQAFSLIAEDVDGGTPEGQDWHKRLLTTMSTPVPDIRPAVISSDTKSNLQEYLAFRHVFRNVYGHRLEAARKTGLLDGLPSTAIRVMQELDAFRTFLLNTAGELDCTVGLQIHKLPAACRSSRR